MTVPDAPPDRLVALFGAAEIDHFAALATAHSADSSPLSPFESLRRKFVIGFTARAGSTLLAQNLFPYGVAAWEFLNPTHIKLGTYVRAAQSYREYCADLVRAYGVNRVFGLKAHASNMIPLFLIGEFPAHLGSWRFVHLTRENVIRQAISLVIAKKQDNWVSWRPPRMQVVDGDYSRAEIEAALDQIRRNVGLWERFFSTFDIEPLRLSYEEIVDDVVSAARRVADFCGLELGGEALVARFQMPAVERQSTAINAAWERRFATECLENPEGARLTWRD